MPEIPTAFPGLSPQLAERVTIARTEPVTLEPREVYQLAWYLGDSRPAHAYPVERLRQIEAIRQRLLAGIPHREPAPSRLSEMLEGRAPSEGDPGEAE